MRQREFLEKGVRGLKPLRMQEVADEVGVHISTVSRAVSGKYAQTPRGTFALKYFFTGGTPKATGGVASGTYLFALPGSTGACKDAWDGILVHQLDYRFRPCNFVELMPRLRER